MPRSAAAGGGLAARTTLTSETAVPTPTPLIATAGRSFLYFEKRRGSCLCVACNAVITVTHILIEYADLLEIRKKYFEEKSLGT